MFAPASPKSLFLFPNHTHSSPSLLKPHPTIIPTSLPKPHKLLKPISASQLPNPPPPPPSSQQPNHQSLSPGDILHILRNRLGLWHQYAPHISTLDHQFSFSDSAIEESTGISCVEQNRLVVAAQVRDSLFTLQVGEKVVSFFDNTAGADLLYELRLLSDSQLAAAASYFAARPAEDPKAAQELACAMEDFPWWRGLGGRGSLPTPGDCLAFMHVHLSRKLRNEAERTAALQQAMEAAETEWVKRWVFKFCKADAARVRVPVVSVKVEDVLEATSVVRMPVCSAEEGKSGVAGAPDRRMVGEFSVVMAEKPQGRWAVLPGWKRLLEIERGGVVVRFKDGNVLPSKVGGVFAMDEEILVVVNREKKAVVEDEGFYLVANPQDSRLKVEKGGWLKDKGMKDSLGIVVLVLRLPANAHDLQFLEDTPTKASDNNVPHFQFPTVDFNGVNGDQRSKIVDEIRRAAETWGSFRLINHGIPIGILDNVIESVRRFHEQPKEAKSGIYTIDARKKWFLVSLKLICNLRRRQQLLLGNQRDTLSYIFDVDPPQPEELPEICRDEMLEYKKHVFKLGETLFGLISEALGLRMTYLQDLGCLKPMLMLCNYYQHTPQAELIRPNEHTDNVFLGIILQDHIGGLQVLHQQCWINVEPVHGALIVNIGDQLQLATNGKLKAVMHRVVAKREGPRISIGSFFHRLPPLKGDNGRMKEPMSGENPAMHRSWENFSGERESDLNGQDTDVSLT